MTPKILFTTSNERADEHGERLVLGKDEAGRFGFVSCEPDHAATAFLDRGELRALRDAINQELGEGDTPGVAAIAYERFRQMEDEGFDALHDDAEHDSGILAAAGAAYAFHAGDQLHPYTQGDGGDDAPHWWPFESSWWKPGAPLRDLTKAGALIAAEIDRVMRNGDGKQ